MTGDARRQYVASWLSAACLAEGISESPLLWLDGVELTNATRSCEMAGVAVSRLDILARQRRRSAAGSVRIETSAVSALRRTTAPDRDHGWQWPSPRQSRVASTRVHESRHKLSGQRMMRMKTHQASGRASALMAATRLHRRPISKHVLSRAGSRRATTLRSASNSPKIDHEALTSARHPAMNRAEFCRSVTAICDSLTTAD